MEVLFTCMAGEFVFVRRTNNCAPMVQCFLRGGGRLSIFIGDESLRSIGIGVKALEAHLLRIGSIQDGVKYSD